MSADKNINMHRRQIFKDEADEASFLEDGFVVLPVADDVNSDALLKAHYDLEPDYKHDVYLTIFSTDRLVRQKWSLSLIRKKSNSSIRIWLCHLLKKVMFSPSTAGSFMLLSLTIRISHEWQLLLT